MLQVINVLKFKWKTEFKETEIGEIPRNWEVYKLDRVVKKFKNGGTPSTKINEYWEGDIPWITSDHLEGLYEMPPGNWTGYKIQ